MTRPGSASRIDAHGSSANSLAGLLDGASETAIVDDWSGARLAEHVEARGRRLFGTDGLGGAIVALPLANTLESLAALLVIGAAGGAALIVSPKAVEAERAACLARGKARLWLSPGEEGGVLRLDGAGLAEPGAVLLSTSGSTGEAKIVARSAESLIDEGERYRLLIGAGEGTRVALAAPIAHAYALGWFAGCLAARWTALPLDPSHLGAIARAVDEDAAWTVMTPAIARLVARRPSHGRGPSPAKGRVMVGAGPVTDDLLNAFAARFGIGLARNYGSTETGAVFSALGSPPPGRIGGPMPGVRHRIVDEAGGPVGDGKTGALEIDLGLGWHAMGDLVMADPGGEVRVLGRAGQAVRRGDTWIATGEVEALLSGFPGVRALRARKAGVRADGDDALALDLWPVDPAQFPVEAFRHHAATRLGAGNRPDRIELHLMLSRGDGGKIAAPRIWRPGPATVLAEAARGYKRAELLFALHETGVLSRLTEGRSAEDIAEDIGCDAGTLEALLVLAEAHGLVKAGGPVQEEGQGQEPATGVEGLIVFEAAASRGLATREIIARLAARGFSGGETLTPASPHREIYLAAMNGPAAQLRAGFGLRALALSPGARMLEITAGPGLYGERLMARDGSAHAARIAVGPAGDGLGEPLAEGAFDGVVLANALRWPPVADRLCEIVAALAPGGRLLVDDLFFDGTQAGADFALDWLTHGGAAFFTEGELTEHLAGLGLATTGIAVAGIPGARLVLARQGRETGGPHD